MKKRAKFLILVFILLLIFMSASTVKLIINISNYSKLINYVGIVRGASQRIFKLETNNRPDDNLINYVDEILQELSGKGNNQYHLVVPEYQEYQENLSMMEKQWNYLKEQITSIRNGGSKEALLDESEGFFQLANDAVFTIEGYSNMRVKNLLIRVVAIAVLCILTWSFLLYFFVRKSFHLERANTTLKNIVYKDELTGANNMDKFKIDATKILSDYPNEKFAIFYTDFENFKYTNDIFGYPYGDYTLKKYVELITKDMREHETFGRGNADRFVILRKYQDKAELVKRQKEIDQKLVLDMQKQHQKYEIRVVSGICCIEDIIEKLGIDGLLNRANFAQKTVKNHPGPTFAFYNENIRNKLIEENTIKGRMREALKKEEFIVYFQPKVGVKSGKIECAEALVRWGMPEKGIISPGVFIPIFEKNLLISLLDQYVFEKVCCWIRRRIDLHQSVVPISINVSKIQFYNPDFVQIYVKIRNKYQIPEGLLEIEFTESVAFENKKYFLQIVNELHENGFSCSLDDFGKEYSSLSLVKELPIDMLKMDAMFFLESNNLERDHILIRGIISMIKELDIKTVAEGIEHKNQVEFLKSVGCDFIQGFVFYKPMPEEEFAKILATEMKK